MCEVAFFPRPTKNVAVMAAQVVWLDKVIVVKSIIYLKEGT